MRSSRLFTLAVALTSATAKLTWGTTKYLFVFGDSYTTDGYNISAGVESPVPGFTSSNGPNWVNALGTTFNVANTSVSDALPQRAPSC